jgi:hypothetical protein
MKVFQEKEINYSFLHLSAYDAIIPTYFTSETISSSCLNPPYVKGVSTNEASILQWLECTVRYFARSKYI